MSSSNEKTASASDPENDTPVDQGTSAVEWVAAMVGAVLFAAMIGYMAYIGLNQVEGTPSIEVRTTPPVRQGDVFHVGFTAINSGGATATGLIVRATLMQGEQQVESRDVTVDYLPTQSNRSGGFFFEHDPAEYKLAVTATAYLDP